MTMTVMMMEHVTTMTLTIKMATGTRDLVVPGSIMVVLMMMKMATGTRDLVVPGSIMEVLIMMFISHHHTHHTDHTDIAGCRVSMGEEANKPLPLHPLHPNLFQGVG